MQNTVITFIGAGNMGHSLIGGLLADGYDIDKIWATDPSADKLIQLRSQFGIHTTQDNQQAAKLSDVIILAVKPQILKTVAKDLADAIQKKNALVISIAAGVRETDLRRWLGEHTAIVRCMPNTPALVRSGATALYANPHVTTKQKNLAEFILRAVGITVWLTDEKQLDTVTALSGSGPAYFFRIMEALETAATAAGLSAEVAHLLTVQTALGAARMALETTEPPATLRQRVTSPGGTTEAALQTLEAGNIAGLFKSAIQMAEQRARELANSFGED